MWIYESSTGRLLHDGPLGPDFLVTGYSGLDDAKDDPVRQAEHGRGPIPIGQYLIGEAFRSEKSGPITMRLTPQLGTRVFGRSGFEIHGDSKEHPGQASHGCIVLDRIAREHISESEDRLLTVVSGKQRSVA